MRQISFTDKIKNLIRKQAILFAALAFYLILSTPYHLDGQHILFNLEPYPDSFGYLVPINNFLTGEGWNYSFQGHSIPQRMPPLYSVVLLPLYALLRTPISFYFTNQILGVLSIIGISLFIRKNVVSKYRNIFEVFALLLYLAHSYIFLLISTPMAENLILPLFIWLIYFLYKKELSVSQIVFSGMLVVGLLLTKYVYAFVGLVFGLLFLHRFLKEKTYKNMFYFIISGTIMFASLILYLVYFNWSSFSYISNIEPFSFTYLKQGLDFYSKTLLGKPTRFIWYNSAFSSVLLTISAVYGLFLIIRNKFKINLARSIILYFSHFVMVLAYFYLDTRFIITIIPLSIVILIQIYSYLKLKKSITILFSIIILLSLMMGQYTNYRTILSQNILGNSRGWQYESVKEIGNFMENKSDSVLITAIHPPLFSLYEYDNIKLLPISSAQEFYDDKIWGDTNLNTIEEIESQHKNGKAVYISNAYITALEFYKTEFETIKNQFDLELIQTGCMDACNIYEVKIPD